MPMYYADDLVTLHLGDCREVTDWLAADVLVTDPPYGVNRTIFSRRTTNGPAYAGEERAGRASDRELGPEHVALRSAALDLWGSKPALVFGSWRTPRPARTRMRLIWDRDRLGNGGVGPWRPCDEEIYLLGDWPNPRSGPKGTTTPSVVRVPTFNSQARDRPNHPSPKPLGLMRHLLVNCPPGVVADPFAGSGSTLIAARDLGRKAVGVELDERYCEVAAKRLAQVSKDCLDFGESA